MQRTMAVVFLFAGIVLFTAGVFTHGSMAADCIDYAEYLHWVGRVDTPGEAPGIAVVGSYAYVADGISPQKSEPLSS